MRRKGARDREGRQGMDNRRLLRRNGGPDEAERGPGKGKESRERLTGDS
jgi:hypothetical protein